jgi:hypothetical protein
LLLLLFDFVIIVQYCTSMHSTHMLSIIFGEMTDMNSFVMSIRVQLVSLSERKECFGKCFLASMRSRFLSFFLSLSFPLLFRFLFSLPDDELPFASRRTRGTFSLSLSLLLLVSCMCVRVAERIKLCLS